MGIVLADQNNCTGCGACLKQSQEITELKDKVFRMESTVNQIDDKTEQLYNSKLWRGWRKVCRIYRKIRGV